MNHPRQWIGVAVLTVLAALSLTACQGAPTATVAAPEVTAELPTAAPLPTLEPNYCLDCHTDKDQLIATAKIEEEVEKEDEGAG
ncbi:MAG: hypothetical protein JW987_15585 [Anaerolineaceae bacterium]|nr:hypothetical protein [Anaerolineaceae bacterium]